MMPPKVTPRPRRKRQRRRKVLSSSSSSNSSSGSQSSSSESSSSEGDEPKTEKGKGKVVIQNGDVGIQSPSVDTDNSSSSDVSSSSSSSSSSDFEDDAGPSAKRGRLARKQKTAAGKGAPPAAPSRVRSPSTIPSSPTLPPGPPLILAPPPRFDHPPNFLFPYASTSCATKTAPPSDADLAFRAWYMDTLINRFSSELDGLRQDPEMSKPIGQTRFQVLIEALASGADIFDSKGEWGALWEEDEGPRLGGEKGLVLDTLEMEKNGPLKNHVNGNSDGMDIDGQDMDEVEGCSDNSPDTDSVHGLSNSLGSEDDGSDDDAMASE